MLAGVGSHVELDWPSTDTGMVVDAPAGEAYVTAQDRGDVGVLQVSLYGTERVAWAVRHRDRVCTLLAVAHSAQAIAYCSLTEPPEAYVHSASGDRPMPRRLHDVPTPTVRPEVLRFRVTASDGVESDGWLMTPPGPGPFPTVLCIHGGPNDAYGNGFMIDFHLLLAAGFAVTFGNFRGSGGYGDHFHALLAGEWGELGERDHHALVDAAVATGRVDTRRLGVYGLSHGGYAVCWLIGRSRRFRAGVAESATTDLVSFYGTTDAPDFWLLQELGGTPEDYPERYRARSPLAYASECRAPLLLIAADDDLRAPASQSEQYFRSITRNGLPSAMLRLPHGGHVASWSGPSAARNAQNEALIDWFERYP